MQIPNIYLKKKKLVPVLRAILLEFFFERSGFQN